MPKVKILRSDLEVYLKRRNLAARFEKQAGLLSKNPHHPSLHTELLEPKNLRIYSFRIDRKYRAIFIYHDGEIEVIDVNAHYQS